MENMNGEQLELVVKIMNNIKHLDQDDIGIFFWGGKKGDEIECIENKEILVDNERRMMRAFKHRNWSNMRKSSKPVGNHLRFLLCKITGKKVYESKIVKNGNSTARKYYIPDCISINLKGI